MSKQPIHKNFSGNWDSVAYWYDGWMGSAGSEFHREYAIPFVFDLIEFQGHERTLDVGCGQGVLAPSVARASRRYIGIDISRIMIGKAMKRHSKIHNAQFIRSNVADTGIYKKYGPFDVAIMLLCIQDMPELRETFQSISAVLKPGGRIVIVMTHPCFRTPRMTGWGFDPKRKLAYRRIDGYITSRRIPIQLHGRKNVRTFTYHRPIQEYLCGLIECGFRIDSVKEKTATIKKTQQNVRGSAQYDNPDIPGLFGIGATNTNSRS